MPEWGRHEVDRHAERTHQPVTGAAEEGTKINEERCNNQPDL